MKENIRGASLTDLRAALCMGHASVSEALRKANKWAVEFGLARRSSYSDWTLSLESWDAEDISNLLDEMTLFRDGLKRCDAGPDVDGLPIVVAKFGENYGLVEGRFRALRRASSGWRHAVLVIAG